MRDSYERFFNHFKIDFQDIINFGVNEDTIYPEEQCIKNEWANLLFSIENNKTVYIRGYGRDAKGTDLYKDLYIILLNNSNIVKDPTNNNFPTKLLERITGYSKYGKSASIRNYQVSHIFGRTKNPFLFTAPWNIVWKPKLLDPFTGHESKGKNTNLYKREFEKKAIELYSNFIEEYNQLAGKYFAEDKLKDAFNQLENRYLNNPGFKRFKQDATIELSKIVIS